MNRRYSTILVVTLILVRVLPLAAQDAPGGAGDSKEPPPQIYAPPAHALGDQMLQISVGPLVPLFFQALDHVALTGLSLGGAGSLQWNAYLNRTMRLGLEIGGMFSFTRRGNTLLMVPITVNYSYLFGSYPFEFPVHVGLGVNVVRYQEDTYLDPIIKPGISAFWQFDITWSFGLNLTYWWVPHISTISREDTRFGNFLEITLSALYNF